MRRHVDRRRLHLRRGRHLGQLAVQRRSQRPGGCQRLPRGRGDRPRGANRRVCPPVAIEPVGTTCLGDNVALEVPQFENNPLAQSLANYTWTGPNGFSATTATAFIADAEFIDAGNYLLEVTFTGLECLLQSADYELLVHEPTPSFDAPGQQCLEGNSFRFCRRRRSVSRSCIHVGVRASLSPISKRRGRKRYRIWQRRLAPCGVDASTKSVAAASVVDSIFIELPPDLSAFDVEVWPPRDVFRSP